MMVWVENSPFHVLLRGRRFFRHAVGDRKDPYFQKHRFKNCAYSKPTQKPTPFLENHSKAGSQWPLFAADGIPQQEQEPTQKG